MRLLVIRESVTTRPCGGVSPCPDEGAVIASTSLPVSSWIPSASRGTTLLVAIRYRPSSLARQRRSGPRFPFPVPPHLLRGDAPQTAKVEQPPAPQTLVAGCLVIWAHRRPRDGDGQRHTALCKPENHRSASARIALRSRTTQRARYARYPCATIPFLERHPNTQIGVTTLGEILKLEPEW